MYTDTQTQKQTHRRIYTYTYIHIRKHTQTGGLQSWIWLGNIPDHRDFLIFSNFAEIPISKGRTTWPMCYKTFALSTSHNTFNTTIYVYPSNNQCKNFNTAICVYANFREYWHNKINTQLLTIRTFATFTIPECLPLPFSYFYFSVKKKMSENSLFLGKSNRQLHFSFHIIRW